MRYRTMNDDGPPVDYAIVSNVLSQDCGGTKDMLTTVTLSGTHTERLSLRTITDVVTPNFKRLIKMGVIINNPLTQTTLIQIDKLSNLYSAYNWEKYSSCSPLPKWLMRHNVSEGTRPSSTTMGSLATALPSAPDLETDVLVSQAIMEAWSKVGLDKTMMIVQLAEMKKTIVSLTSIAKRAITIKKAIMHFDAKDKKFLANQMTGKQLSDRYMEMRYSLRPLYYDISGVIDAINGVNENVNDRLTFRSRKENSYFQTTEETIIKQSYVDALGQSYKKAKLVKTVSRGVEVRAGILTQVKSDSEFYDWGFTKPIESIWELVPYSFVIDWFFNVGTTIAAWTPKFGLDCKASWYTITDTVIRSADYVSTWTEGPSTPAADVRLLSHEYVNTHCGMSEVSITKTRVPDPSRSVLPSFQLRLDALKLLDLLIILKNIKK